MTLAESHEAESFLDRVDAIWAEYGLEEAGRPVGPFPRMPDSPTELDDKFLMEAYAQVSAWLEFLDVALAAAEAETGRRTAAVKLTEARAVRSSRETTMKGKERMAELDETVIRARRQEAFAWERETLLKARLSGLERIASVLSREITRRTSYGSHLRLAGGRMTA